MRDLTKLSDAMDSKLKDKVMSKVKDAAGGARQMSASDISNMGDMVKDMNVREMKNLDASAVRSSLSTFSDNAKDMNRAQKMQLRKTVRDSVGGAGNWTSDDVVNAAAFIGRDRDLMKKIDKDVLISGMTNLSKQDMDPKSARTMVSKIKESADYDEPRDFDTSKFKEVGNLAKGFSPRFVKNMTNVDFGSLLSSGDLKDIDFSENFLLYGYVDF
ncbi:uncharacterized protein LOC123562302 [Mercenaria mercenaria]|uniref:uncharacterized protein LOC123562302 n=1 Tax=Mercenaria mercenaria TaxID=6596 RepID=UPI00234F371B|nr:uncharacterized protein LOC123562302 [Mercenaria mercenaria]